MMQVQSALKTHDGDVMCVQWWYTRVEQLVRLLMVADV